MTAYFAETALLPDGWAERVRIEIAATGTINGLTLRDSPRGAERFAGPVIAGIPNLHSQAFRRALAGLAERAAPGGGGDPGGRRALLRHCLARIGPEEVAAIAAQLYLEMLKAGFTAVGEFHVLHHAADGGAFDDPAELSHHVIAAARRVGIGITHLPVLHGCGGFGGVPAAEAEQRFLNTPEELLEIVARLRRAYGDDPQVRIGAAAHGLGAVTPEMLAALVAGVQALDDMAPLHIPVAATEEEVAAGLAWSGARPVEWLLHNAPVDGRWCLVHATHITPAEGAALAASDAVAGLCPTTEASLGRGVFPLRAYLAEVGTFGIGSGANVSVSPGEELRWLEYGQRLLHPRPAGGTALGGPGGGRSAGAALVRAALEGGAKALGRPIGRIEAGQRADLVVLDPDHPVLVERRGDRLLDALVFAGSTSPVRDVMVGGAWVVQNRRHGAEVPVLAAYRRAVALLAAD